MARFTLKPVCLLLALFLLFWQTPRAAAAPYIQQNRYDYSLVLLKLLMSNGATEVVQLSGLSLMEVRFQGTAPGSAADGNGNGRDEVAAEMVVLNLVGFSHALGEVRLRLRPGFSSLGMMEEQVNNSPGVLDVPPYMPTGNLDSSFDMFLEVEAGGRTMHTLLPLHWFSTLTSTSPSFTEAYASIGDVLLLDASDQPVGLQIGLIRYQPNTPLDELDHFDQSLGALHLGLPDGSTQIIPLTGSSAMKVHFQGAAPGSAGDTDNDGLDQVSAELVSLNLSGFTPALGEVRLRLRPGLFSVGEMEENVNNSPSVLDVLPFMPTGALNSFFDVFFELDVAGLTLHADQSLRLSTQLNQVPPAAAALYESSTQLALMDAEHHSTRYLVKWLQYQPHACRFCSDIDRSGVTDDSDLLLLSHNWLWIRSMGDIDNLADLNCDAHVNLLDFALLASHWLDACCP